MTVYDRIYEKFLKTPYIRIYSVSMYPCMVLANPIYRYVYSLHDVHMCTWRVHGQSAHVYSKNCPIAYSSADINSRKHRTEEERATCNFAHQDSGYFAKESAVN
jgi:hypothetical protein